MRRFTFATLIAVLCITLLVPPSHSSAQIKTWTGTAPALDLLGVPVPDFDLVQIGGNSVKSDDLKGNVVVLDLWATWCAPCIDELPNFNALSEKYKDKRVRVIGIAVSSGSFDKVSASIAGLNIRYPVLLGTDKIEADFGVIGFPLTFVLTRNWTIYKWYLGHLPHKKELIEQQIELLLR